jgi:hypothetical protein
VANIGTSSGPDWAAICRERKPDLRASSNNFLEVGYNFLDSGMRRWEGVATNCLNGQYICFSNHEGISFSLEAPDHDE